MEIIKTERRLLIGVHVTDSTFLQRHEKKEINKRVWEGGEDNEREERRRSRETGEKGRNKSAREGEEETIGKKTRGSRETREKGINQSVREGREDNEKEERRSRETREKGNK